jgi:hypothetical protein
MCDTLINQVGRRKTMLLFHEFRHMEADGKTVQVHLNVYESPTGDYSVVKTVFVGEGSHIMELPFRVASIEKVMECFTEYRELCIFGEKVEKVSK